MTHALPRPAIAEPTAPGGTEPAALGRRVSGYMLASITAATLVLLHPSSSSSSAGARYSFHPRWWCLTFSKMRYKLCTAGSAHCRARVARHAPDDEVHAVHEQADADEDDEEDLVVAQVVADRLGRHARGVERRPRELVVPRDRAQRRARQRRREEVVEAQRERGGPRADQADLEERVRELVRRPPEPERATEVFELRRAGSAGPAAAAGRPAHIDCGENVG
jgi:hypothetical protein